MSEILVEVARGKLAESIHRGDIAVVRSNGELLRRLGDCGHVSYMRSASKPIQAIAMLKAGIAEKYGLDSKEVAILMSSHSGEQMHIDVLTKLLEKTGINASSLRCGTHRPLNAEAALRLIERGRTPDVLHCNCSGKHIGQVAASKAKGYPAEGYDKQEHPIQSDILEVMAEFCGLQPKDIVTGIDGCGVPIYGMPLYNMALGYANLCHKGFLNGKYQKAQEEAVHAMTEHPEMIAGTGMLDTELLLRFGDRLVCKSGFEGVFCLGLKKKGIGIAIKIEDGNKRAVSPVVLEIIKQLGIASDAELIPFSDYWHPQVKNHRGEKVGAIRPVFSL